MAKQAAREDRSAATLCPGGVNLPHLVRRRRSHQKCEQRSDAVQMVSLRRAHQLARVARRPRP